LVTLFNNLTPAPPGFQSIAKEWRLNPVTVVTKQLDNVKSRRRGLSLAVVPVPRFGIRNLVSDSAGWLHLGFME
jgi:hypothetical protein